MKLRVFLLVSLTASIWAQGRGGPGNREAPVTSVPFDRILKANQEPQNWLTYGGSLTSQRHSQLTQITPENAKELELKSVLQSRSPEKGEVTPLAVDVRMNTTPSPHN